jgi:hypothetical protein
VHRLIRHRRRVRWHWLPLQVTWYVLAMVLRNWWGLVFNEAQGVWGDGWIFFYYGHVLLLLYLVASAVLPDEIPDAGLDLREFYLENRRQLWGLLACVNLVLLAFTLLRPAFTDVATNWMAVVSNLVMGLVALSLAWVRRFAYHAAVVVVLVALLLMELVFKF